MGIELDQVKEVLDSLPITGKYMEAERKVLNRKKVSKGEMYLGVNILALAFFVLQERDAVKTIFKYVYHPYLDELEKDFDYRYSAQDVLLLNLELGFLRKINLILPIFVGMSCMIAV